MAEFKFGVTGKERKNFVEAVSEILGQPKKYLGVPNYGYEVGTYTIDKHGTLHGEYNMELLMGLMAAGFTRTDIAPEELQEAETASITMTTDKATETSEPEADTQDETEQEAAEDDSISITLPLDGFTPETIDNLCKMVLAKEILIKKALGVENLPIRVSENGIEFPWFTAEHNNDMMAFAQFITALATTAKEKKRVTAKSANTDNMRFSMRVFCIGLGLVGSKYSRIRALMTKPLPGNGAWRYYQNEKTTEDDAQSEATERELPDTATEDATTALEISDDSTAMPDISANLDESEVNGDE